MGSIGSSIKISQPTAAELLRSRQAAAAIRRAKAMRASSSKIGSRPPQKTDKVPSLLVDARKSKPRSEEGARPSLGTKPPLVAEKTRPRSEPHKMASRIPRLGAQA